ncbi:hypothetical protein PFTANZ_03525 [Plasmodium falciparum Tanzania (2000708)]|uniref:Uncharacterized protein n=1 Tax=Plasmodium falciparum Tanzania (2000708) TaxID=1036725 RepID=A0A024W6H8_PLAFA|nr:hypothetical protein PFTANZ_03525 [Plasmodium falciparum Tanzania (2000708)]
MYIFNRKRLLVKKIFLYLQNMSENKYIYNLICTKNNFFFYLKNTYSFIILFIILFFSFKENIYFNLENK